MNTLTQVFDWLLAVSLRASLLTLAILLLQAAWHRHLGARMRYALWLPVLIVLLMPVLPQSRWSIEHVFQTPPPPAQIIPAPSSPGMKSTPVVFAAAAPRPEPINWQRILLLSWLFVSAAILTLGSISFLLTLRRFKQSRHPASDELLATLAQIAAEVRLRHVPRVLIASSVSSPSVTGLLRPTLLLPAQFDNEFTPAEARLVLKHELMHLKRGDLPLNALMCVLMALHWFNPLLWIAFFKIRADREAACDAQVLHNASDGHRIEYGHALLKVETAFCPRGFSLGFVGIFQRGAALRSRIHSIATHRAPHPSMKAMITLCIVLMTFFGITRAQQPKPDENAPLIAIEIKIVKFENAADWNFGGRLPDKETNAFLPAVLLSPEKLAVQLRELMRNESTNTTSYPRMVTVSGHELMVKSVVNQPCKDKDGKVAELPIGLVCKFTPVVNGEVINLGIDIDDSHLVDPATGAAISEVKGEYPTVRTRTYKASHESSDGQSWVIAGWDDDKPQSKRPVLYIITPHVIDPKKGGLPAGMNLTTGTNNTAEAKTAPTTDFIKQKLEKIILPHIQFQDASVEECLEYLRIQSRAHDTLAPSSADPSVLGISIIYKAGNPASKAAISLDLKEVPLGEALRYVVALADLKMSIQPYAVLVGQTIPTPAANAPEPQSKTAPTTDYIKQKLEKTILPRVQFQGASAAECLEYLRVKSRELDPTTTDPAARGVNILYKPDNSPSSAVISLDLKDVPLIEALRYAVELADLKMIIQPYAVLIVSADNPEVAKVAAAPSVLNPPDKLGEIVITAQQTSIDPSTAIQTAKGDARCQVWDTSIQAAELICDRKAHQLKIHGPFTIINGGNQKHSSTSSESSAVLDLASGKLTTVGVHTTEILTPPASKIIIPSVEFRDATLTECIDFIRFKSRELDPDKEGVNIIVKPGGDASVRLSLSLHDVPLSEALSYCAELANHKVTSDAQSYFLTPVSAEAPANKDQASSTAAQPSPSAAEAKAAELRKARPQHYDFNKAQFGDVLRFLATDASINFISLPDDNPINQRLITFNIRSSPFEVLETLCRANGLMVELDHDRWLIRPSNDSELIVKSYAVPQTRGSVETILKDISLILGDDETKPDKGDTKPSVTFKKEENSVYVKGTRMQHSWVGGYFKGLNGSAQSANAK